jgi:nitrate/nitrite transporter NarK
LAAKKKAEEDAELRLKQRKERMLLAVVLGIGGIIFYHSVAYIWSWYQANQ